MVLSVMHRTIKLTIAYEGSEYVGWQRQPNGRSIQGQLEDSFRRIEGAPVTIIGAGRTDAGVHALGQVASTQITHAIEVADLVRALNAMLPTDIRVLEAIEMPNTFNARKSVVSKVYRYRVIIGPFVSPFERRYAWHIEKPLDCLAMRDGGEAFLGEHDFAGFQAAGSEVKTSVRRISRLDVNEVDLDRTAGGGRLMTIEVEGNGFLRHMVRTIVGTLVEVGTQQRVPADVAQVLALRNRAKAGPTAPAEGLFLVRVNY